MTKLKFFAPRKAAASQTQHQFAEIVQQFSDDLYRYAYWLCGEQATAEDLVQETFARAWRARDSLQTVSAAKAWLITILRNEHARLYARQRPEFVDITVLDLEDDSRATPEAQLVQHRLRAAIAKLAPEYREPLVLQVIAGFSGEEIAALLNLNKQTVLTRLHRARLQLQTQLADAPPKRKNKS